MKNIQVIDGAENCVYDIFVATLEKIRDLSVLAVRCFDDRALRLGNMVGSERCGLSSVLSN